MPSWLGLPYRGGGAGSGVTGYFVGVVLALPLLVRLSRVKSRLDRETVVI